MAFAAELESRLKEFSVNGLVEIRENGVRAAPFAGPPGSRGPGEKPLLHVWPESDNLCHGVPAITDHSGPRLPLTANVSAG